MNQLREIAQQHNDKPKFEDTLKALLSRLYKLPVGPEPQLIPFEQLGTLQIERYEIEPLLQVWAGDPGTPNRILTLFLKDGRAVYVKALYDASTNQIQPPEEFLYRNPRTHLT